LKCSGGYFLHLKKRGALLRFGIIRPLAPLRHGDAVALRQKLERFRKGETLTLLDEFENIAFSVTAEAFVKTERAIHVE